MKKASTKITRNKDGSASAIVHLATGSVVQRSDYSTLTWDTGPQWDEGVPGDPHMKIQKAVKYYSIEPLVNKSIKLLAQLSNDSFKISAEDKKVETFFKTWWKDIKGTDFMSWFFLEYYRSGNVVTMKTLVPYVPSTKAPNSRASEMAVASKSARDEYNAKFDDYIRAYKMVANGRASSAVLAKADSDFASAASKWSLKSIPGAYTVLSPLGVDFDGPSDIPWLSGVYMNVSDSLKKAIQSPAKEFKEVIKSIPKEVVKGILSGESKIHLPNYLCGVAFRDKQPYEKWAEPLCTHAFEAIEYKRELREMDRHTVRSVRNRILKVTIGSDKFPVLDTKELKRLADDFNNPSRNLTIFWNHTLKIEFVEPNLESLNIEKYQPALDDIRTCFGIAPVLTGESGSSLGNNVINVKGLVELVQEGQDAFISWFNNEVRQVCQSMGLKEQPEGSFNKLNLKDENDFIRVMMQLVDRQIISYETTVDTIGFYFPKELERLRNEQDIRAKEGILVTQKAPTQGGESGDSPSPQGGRPEGVSEPGGRQKSKNKPKKPSGQKMMGTSMAPDMIDIISDFAKAQKKHMKDDNENGFVMTASSLVSKRHGLDRQDVKDAILEADCSRDSMSSIVAASSRIWDMIHPGEKEVNEE